ncbi:MAG: TonB-dependent receptor, partial [Acidobacteriaceae bacterium]|nr:TonB-dependent receptor [Acidobacteriaceae bacterium]
LGIAQQVGLTGTDPEFPPTINVTGYTGLVGSGNHLRYQTPIRNNEYVDNVTLIRGSHAIKFGGSFRYSSNLDLNRSGAGGRFTFNNMATGNGLASLLLGWVTSATLTDVFPTQSRGNTAGAFVQDDWKVTPRFTLNIGLRYDIDQPRWEQIDNRQNSFDTHAINPVSGTPGIVLFSGRDGVSKYAHNWDLNNFGPRFGFAWRARERWVLRGGAAVVYEPEYDSATPLVAGLGFSLQGNFVSPDGGLTPAFLLRNGMPAIKPPTEADLTPAFGAVPLGASPTTSVEFFDRNNRRTGYLETFNFDIQRELSKNVLVEIGYLGTLGHKLAGSNNLSLDQVPTNLLGPGNAQVRRPFPQFSDVGIIAPAIGNSNYDGLNLHLEKRFSAGLHFQANYTFSRFIDDMESRVPASNAGSSFVNNYDRKQNRGLSGNDVKHRLIWSSVYELPVGKGKPADLGFWNHFIAGWSTGVIAEIRSGSPYGVTEQTNTTGSFSPNERPNVVGDPVLPSDRPLSDKLNEWFNVAAFAQPPQYVFGNAGRTAGYGPGAVNIDVSVLKDFAVRENQRLQFRAEMLNAPNHPNFGLPNTARGAPNFGRITSLAPTGTQSRVVQLGLHYQF